MAGLAPAIYGASEIAGSSPAMTRKERSRLIGNRS